MHARTSHNEKQSAQYWYNGAHRSARAFTRETDEARELVGEVVRVLMRGRERREGEWEGGEGEGEGWRPNVAVANCYRGGQEVRCELCCSFALAR